ncbi:MAG: DUF2092 domain-containing protein [Pseudomonadota bacterium]
MRRLLGAALAVIFLATPSAIAQTAAPDAPPGLSAEESDAKARMIASAAADYLAAQERVAFRWFVSYDTVLEGREKLTYFRSGSVLLARGEGFYSRAERGDRVRDYHFDGSVFTVSGPEADFYAEAPFEGSFDALVARLKENYDLVLPVWEMLSAELPDSILEGVEGAAYQGTTLIAGQLAHHLSFTQYEEDWQLWVSAEDEAEPVVLALVGTHPHEQGWPQYRAHFLDWDFAPEIAEGSFRFTPDADDRRVNFPVRAKEGAE